MKILLLKDEQSVVEELVKLLRSQHYVVDVADSYSVWACIETFPYNLLLLDVMSPELDGVSVCRKLRYQGYEIPILLLSSKNNIADRVIGLDAGADDYLAKPFDVHELLARIRMLLRRGGRMLPTLLSWGDLSLDSISCYTTYQNQHLDLTPKEYSLLELLLSCNTRVLTRPLILEHLWSFDDPPGEDAVKTHIKRLRQKLKALGAPTNLVETVYGLGYRLNPNLKETNFPANKNIKIAEVTSLSKPVKQSRAHPWHRSITNHTFKSS